MDEDDEDESGEESGFLDVEAEVDDDDDDAMDDDDDAESDEEVSMILLQNVECQD